MRSPQIHDLETCNLLPGPARTNTQPVPQYYPVTPPIILIQCALFGLLVSGAPVKRPLDPPKKRNYHPPLGLSVDHENTRCNRHGHQRRRLPANGEAQTTPAPSRLPSRLIYIQFLCQPNAYALSAGRQKSRRQVSIAPPVGVGLKIPTIKTCE